MNEWSAMMVFLFLICELRGVQGASQYVACPRCHPSPPDRGETAHESRPYTRNWWSQVSLPCIPCYLSIYFLLEQQIYRKCITYFIFFLRSLHLDNFFSVNITVNLSTFLNFSLKLNICLVLTSVSR